MHTAPLCRSTARVPGSPVGDYWLLPSSPPLSFPFRESTRGGSWYKNTYNEDRKTKLWNTHTHNACDKSYANKISVETRQVSPSRELIWGWGKMQEWVKGCLFNRLQAVFWKLCKQDRWPSMILSWSFLLVLVLRWDQKNTLPMNEAAQCVSGGRTMNRHRSPTYQLKGLTAENGAAEPESESYAKEVEHPWGVREADHKHKAATRQFLSHPAQRTRSVGTTPWGGKEEEDDRDPGLYETQRHCCMSPVLFPDNLIFWKSPNLFQSFSVTRHSFSQILKLSRKASFELYFQQADVHLVLWLECADAAEPSAPDGDLWLTGAPSLPHTFLQPGLPNP